MSLATAVQATAYLKRQIPEEYQSHSSTPYALCLPSSYPEPLECSQSCIVRLLASTSATDQMHLRLIFSCTPLILELDASPSYLVMAPQPSSAKCTTLQELHLYTATLLKMMNQEAPMYFTWSTRPVLCSIKVRRFNDSRLKETSLPAPIRSSHPTSGTGQSVQILRLIDWIR